MKRGLTLFLLLVATSSVFAVEVWRSSYTATADTNQPLCATGNHAIVYEVCVSSATVLTTAATHILISSNTANTLYTVGNNTFGCITLNMPVTSTNTHSLAYTKVGTAGVGIHYNCY